MKNKYKKQEKWFWEKEFGIKPGELDNIDPIIDRLNYRDSNANDEDMFWLSTRIKVIRQLDLDSSLITDEGVQHLSKIHIQELRLKGCDVTAKCIDDLKKMETLTLLHLRGTHITLDDIPRLTNLKCLKLLLVNSENSILTIRRKVNKLVEQLPECEFIVNNRGYTGPNEKIR